jgi:hypothetical protein
VTTKLKLGTGVGEGVIVGDAVSVGVAEGGWVAVLVSVGERTERSAVAVDVAAGFSSTGLVQADRVKSAKARKIIHRFIFFVSDFKAYYPVNKVIINQIIRYSQMKLKNLF